MRIVFVQTGDYRAAVERFDRGENQTYGNQRATVEYVAELAGRYPEIIVICTRSSPYDTVLKSGVRAIGIDDQQPNGPKALLELIGSLKPTHLIARIPNPKLIKLGLSMGARVLPLFADSFDNLTLRQKWFFRGFAGLLNSQSIDVVCNHNINAARSLCQIGVHANKAVPFDYDRGYAPDQYTVKSQPESPDTLRALYVGAVSIDKGVFDVLDALPIVNSRAPRVKLTVIGSPTEALEQHAKELGVNHQVSVLGNQPHHRVLDEMRAHDTVIVPSRKSYPEGMPNTIFETIAMRTPMIASDHPMFTPIFRDEENCVMFKSGDPASIADAIERLRSNPELYHKLSAGSQGPWDQLNMAFNWHEIIEHWLEGTPESIERLRSSSVARLQATMPVH